MWQLDQLQEICVSSLDIRTAHGRRISVHIKL
jgi:hypothetical protein